DVPVSQVARELADPFGGTVHVVGDAGAAVLFRTKLVARRAKCLGYVVKLRSDFALALGRHVPGLLAGLLRYLTHLLLGRVGNRTGPLADSLLQLFGLPAKLALALLRRPLLRILPLVLFGRHWLTPFLLTIKRGLFSCTSIALFPGCLAHNGERITVARY